MHVFILEMLNQSIKNIYQAVETLISPFYPILAVRNSLECHNVGGKICSRSRTLATCEQTSVSFAYTRIFLIFFSIRFIFKCIILFHTELYCSIVMRKCCMRQGGTIERSLALISKCHYGSLCNNTI